jgi:hypothetical protein
MATYQQAEAALARVYDLPITVQAGALRARLRHFVKLGLGPSNRPGKGQRITYDLNDIMRWLLALELQQFGMGPNDVVAFVKQNWPGIKDALDVQQDWEDPDVIVVIKVNFLFPEHTAPSQVMKLEFLREADSRGTLPVKLDRRERACVFNLSRRYADLIEALDDVAGGHMKW